MFLLSNKKCLSKQKVSYLSFFVSATKIYTIPTINAMIEKIFKFLLIGIKREFLNSLDHHPAIKAKLKRYLTLVRNAAIAIKATPAPLLLIITSYIKEFYTL